MPILLYPLSISKWFSNLPNYSTSFCIGTITS